MYNLYFLKFNNYINRTIKKFDIIDDYSDYISGIRTNMNFNFNDGINTTTEAINLKSSDSEIMKSNYIIIEDIETLELSRWFIMECKKTRGKQYIFSLRRDLVADNYDDILNSTSFIYKGYVEYPDPACIIKENLSFNQKKINELYLKEDDFPFSCIIAYISKQTVFSKGENIINFKVDKSIDYNNVLSWFGNAILTKLDDYVIKSFSAEYTYDGNQLTRTQKINNIIVETGNASIMELNMLTRSEGLLFYINNVIYKFMFDYSESSNTYTYNFKFILIHRDDLVYDLNLDLSALRTSLDDGYFDMLVIPYSSGIFGARYIKEQDILNVMTSLANNSNFYDVQLVPYRPIDTLNYYKENISWSKETSSGTEEYEYEILHFNNNYPITYDFASIYQIDGETRKAFINLFWCQNSKREFQIRNYRDNFNYIENITSFHNIEMNEHKLISNTKILRLCSPNENSIYEFNSAPNNGIDYYNVSLKYNPYTPYIHVSPNYKWLNGGEFNDYRGLICKGNFSLGRATNSWEEYQTQNKNFQETFNRQIDIMQQEINWSLASGVINTVASGVSGGAMGAAGGVAGIIAGAVAGTTQGVYNTVESQILSRENLQAQKDIFNYNLGSIKARPNTISNNSVLDNNNKIFPYVEFYECTDIEKEIFKNIIKYQGMTINRIGKIKDFLGNENFVQARIVRTDLSDDNHFIEELNNELMKGVFFNAN